MRAIGRDGQEIAPLSPDNILEQAIHPLIGGLIATGLLADRLEDNALYRLQRQRFLKTVYLDVAETVESEARLIDLTGGIALEGITIRRERAAVIVRIDLSLAFLINLDRIGRDRLGWDRRRIIHLAITDRDLLAGGSFHAQPRHAHHVLPHIVDINARQRLGHRAGGKSHMVTDRTADIALQDHVYGRRIETGRRCP